MISLRRAFAVAAGLIVLLLGLLTGCDIGAAVEPAPSAAPSAAASGAAAEAAPSVAASAAPDPTPTPSVPQGGALAVRLAADVPDLKPWDLRSRDEEIVADLMYNGLVELDYRLQPQPDLAESWETSADGDMITFTLRSDVQWHDGEPLTADDVEWTLNALRTITPTNSLLFDLRDMIEQVRVPDDRTVALSLTQPYSPLLAELAVPILPRHRLEDRTPEQLGELNFWDEPVGSGPFKLDRREAGQSIAFTRNEAYFRGAPNLDQIALIVAPDADVAANAILDDQLQLAEFPGVTQPFSNTQSLPDVQQESYPENGWYGVVFNMREGRLFADRRVREALALAVDVEALVEDVTDGAGLPIASTLSRASWAYPADLEIPPADPEAARQLLDEAGWVPGEDGVRQKDGQRLETRLWVRGDDPRRVAAAERIAAAAAEIGMQLEVTPANFDTVILAKLAPPYDFDVLLGSWVNAPNSAAFPTNRFYDPDDYPLFHSSQAWQGQGDDRSALRNIGGFVNEDYDRAVEQSRAAYDPAARAGAIQTAQEVLRREYPYLLLWTDRISVVLSDRVRSEAGAIDLNTPRYLWNAETWYLGD